MRNSYARAIRFLLCLFLCLCLLPTLSAGAATNSISDEAGLLEDDQIEVLQRSIDEIASSTSLQVRILTVNSLHGENGTKYLDDLEDKLNLPSAVFILIDMSIDAPAKRAYYINTFDEANEHFTQDRRDAIRDAAIKKLKKGDYYGALDTSLSMIAHDAKTSPKTDSIFFQSWVQLLACLIISGIIVAIMAANSGGKVTTDSHTYLNANGSKLLGQYDHYVRTTTTRVKHEQPNNNHNNNDTHTTSGGHTSGSSSGNF